MPLQKLYSNDITASSYPALAVTATRPTLGVVPAAGRLPYIRLMAILTDAADETGELEIVGWSEDSTGFWVLTLIAQVAVTAGTFTGALDALAGASHLFADVYAITTDTGFTDRVEVGANAANLPGAVMLNPLAYPVIQVRAKVTTAASINVLWEQLDT